MLFMWYLVGLPLSTNINGHGPQGTSSILQALFGEYGSSSMCISWFEILYIKKKKAWHNCMIF